jgi:membrane fusion protein
VERHDPAAAVLSAPSARPPLFRPEALEAHQRRLAGDVVLAQPVSLKLLGALLGALAASALLYVWCAEVARTERVSGYLHPDRGVSVLQPLRAGTVLEVRVQIGQSVHTGDVLVRIRSSQALADGSGLESGLREGLVRQLDELRSKQQAEETLFASQERRLAEELDAVRAKEKQLAVLQDIARDRLSMASQRAGASAALLAKGMASERELQEQLDAVLGLKKELAQLASTRLEHAESERQLRARRESAPAEQRQRLAELRLRLLDTEARVRELDGRSSYAVVSPVDGSVASLQADVGMEVSPELPLAVVVPAGASLEAVLLVPTRAAGLIEEGQAVGLKYEAFPYQEFGIHPARIARIDTAILTAQQIRAPVVVQEPVYRVVARLAEQRVLALGRPYPLQTGMRFSADIVLEKRSLLAWLLEPVHTVRSTPGAASAS